METTMMIDAAQLDALAARLSTLDNVLDDAEKVTLLTVFALAGEALEARIDEKLDVSGFAAGGFNVGLQVGVGGPLPTMGDGLLGSVAKGKKGRKAGGGQQEYYVVTMQDCLITSV